MRRNLPVTQREYKLSPEITLLSTTDKQGRITYANGAFIEASGYSRDELMGQPHNLVRHPDMPPEAFADLWRTIRAGLPWTALVKNRRKDGDHYWVRANAVAMRRGGEVVGYMSVRTCPGVGEVEAAERLYADFREGRAGSIAFERGVIVRHGALSWLSVGKRMSVAARVGVGLALACAPVLVAHALASAGLMPTQVLPLLAVAGAACGYAWLQAQLLRPLRRIGEQAQAVASGRNVQPLVPDRVDEIGALMVAVNQAGLNMRSLIDDVAEQVGGVLNASGEIAAGSQTVGQAGRTIDEVVAQVDKVSALIAEITAVSTEQNTGIAQVHQAVSTLDDTTQQNAALVEQSAAAAESLRQQSGRLAEAVGVYRGH